MLNPNEIKVSFEYRKRGAGDSEPAQWYARIDLPDGSDHHGTGSSPAMALFNASQHWYGKELPE